MRNEKDSGIDAGGRDEGDKGSGPTAQTPPSICGINAYDSVLHRAAQKEIRGSLINLKFYLECACTDIQKVIDWMERTERYEDELKKKQRSENVSGSSSKP